MILNDKNDYSNFLIIFYLYNWQIIIIIFIIHEPFYYNLIILKIKLLILFHIYIPFYLFPTKPSVAADKIKMKKFWTYTIEFPIDKHANNFVFPKFSLGWPLFCQYLHIRLGGNQIEWSYL